MRGFDLGPALLTGVLLTGAALGACGGSRATDGTNALDAETRNAPDGASEEPTEAGEADAATLAPTSDAAGEASEPEASQPAFRERSGTTWEGTGTWSIEIVLPEPAAEAHSVRLVAGGSAQATQDYQLEQSELEIPAGSQALRVAITLVDDRVAEGSETLSLSLAGSDPPASYVLTIADDDDERWPDDSVVSEVDASKLFPGGNLSGLVYQPARAGASAVLWMVRNGPSELFRLVQNGLLFTPTASNEWSQAKTLVFPGGAGAPDAEDLAWTEWGSPLLYVSSERDGSGPSVPTVLAYDTTQAGSTLSPVRAWDLSADLRSLMLQPNAGPEALTWVPDSYLVSAGFRDDASGQLYAPARYPNHGSGLFFVGIEQTGGIYAYALDHVSGAALRVAAIESGQPALMALEFDRDVNYLWAWCDDTCGNRAHVLRIEENPASPRAGRFGVRRRLQRPASLPNVNNEGMTLGPAAECRDNKKSVFWVEDGTDDHVLRRGAIPCGAFLDP